MIPNGPNQVGDWGTPRTGEAPSPELPGTTYKRGPGPAGSGVHRREWKGGGHTLVSRGVPCQSWARGAPPLISEGEDPPAESSAGQTQGAWTPIAGESRRFGCGLVGLGEGKSGWLSSVSPVWCARLWGDCGGGSRGVPRQRHLHIELYSPHVSVLLERRKHRCLRMEVRDGG